jgi:competence protein ComEA
MEEAMRKSIHALLVSVPLGFSAALFAGTAVAGPVDINKADAATIAKELEGIGPSRAKAIVEYREKHGAFKSADDLSKIKGIGSKAIDKNRANLKFGEVAKK